MAKTGVIPEEITYVYGGTSEIKVRIDIDRWEEPENILKKLTVIPTFPLAKGNDSKLTTAKNWVRGNFPGAQIQEVTRKNEPIKLQICGLESRGNGGRAYKIIDFENRLFDLREHIFFEAIQSVGCQPNGQLGGEYIWAVMGGQTKLIRVGSMVYNQLKKDEQRLTLQPLELSALVPGTVYQNKNRDKAVFLGAVRVDRETTLNYLWYEFSKYDEVGNAITSFDHWRFRLNKKHNMIDSVGVVTINSEDAVHFIRGLALKEIAQAEGQPDYTRQYIEKQYGSLSKIRLVPTTVKIK